MSNVYARLPAGNASRCAMFLELLLNWNCYRRQLHARR